MFLPEAAILDFSTGYAWIWLYRSDFNALCVLALFMLLSEYVSVGLRFLALLPRVQYERCLLYFFFFPVLFPPSRTTGKMPLSKNNSADDPALLLVVCIFSANFIFCVILALTLLLCRNPLKNRSCGVNQISYPHYGVKWIKGKTEVEGSGGMEDVIVLTATYLLWEWTEAVICCVTSSAVLADGF